MNPSQVPQASDGHHASNDHRGTREVERNIERTRGAIDRTLDEIGDRLHPQHLLHQAMDLFRSNDDEPSEWASDLKHNARMVARKIKRNPLPAVLIGTGAAWLWMQDETKARRREIHRQWDDLPEHSGSYVDARTGQPYDDDYGADARVSPAWHADYDWSDAHDDEESWTSRAESALSELRDAISDTGRSTKERLGMLAGKMVSLSGLKRSEIQRSLRAQWDDLPEHSGSFVDARTGKPYDASYGEQWRQLAALDSLSSASTSDEDQDEGWRERAEQTLKSVQSHLGDSQKSAKERLSAIGSQLGTFASSSQSFASKYGQAGRRKMRSLSRSTKQRAQQAGDRLSSGYGTSREFITESMDENPMAMGVAVLGLGLLVGSLIPSTRVEDRAMGDSADELKQRGMDAGREALERGQEAASAAGQAAYDEAQRQGLTPSQLAHQAREGAGHLADKVKHQPSGSQDLRSKAEAVAKRAQEAAKDALQGDQLKSTPTGQSKDAAPSAHAVQGGLGLQGGQAAQSGQALQGNQPSATQSAQHGQPAPACDVKRTSGGQ